MSSTAAKRRCLRSDSQRRQSFDRFGDDLCQLLLSYMSLEDKLYYECVCKQWQRLALKTQTVLVLDKFNYRRQRSMTDNLFDTLFKKCPNVTKVEFRSREFAASNRRLKSMMKYCHQLRHLTIEYSRKLSVTVLDQLFVKFGKKLETIGLNFADFDDTMIGTIFRNIKICKNLKSFDCISNRETNDCLKLITSDVMFHKLQKIAIDLTDEDVTLFNEFIDKYKTQITTVYIDINDNCDETVINEFTTGLTQMQELTYLEINYEYFESEFLEILAQMLKEIGLKCNKLRKLSLTGERRTRKLFDIIFPIINQYFKQLKSLQLIGDFYLPKNCTISSLNGLSQLTSLAIISDKDVLKDEFFADIAVNMPNLRSLVVENIRLTNNLLPSLTAVTSLRYIKIFRCSDADCADWVTGIHTDSMYPKVPQIITTQELY